MTICPFAWYELASPDATATAAFYRAVIGWKEVAADLTAFPYTLLSTGRNMVGGICLRPPGADPTLFTGWLGHVLVENISLAIDATISAGGTISSNVETMRSVGRRVMIRDPFGAPLVLFEPTRGSAPQGSAIGVPGHVGWHELRTRDGVPAIDFYRQVFGWRLTRSIQLDGLGTYHLMAWARRPMAAIFETHTPVSMPEWRC